MGSSAKKKKEKKADFQKAKLKVGKARPKNTNATDTSFQAKSIVLKQQNLSEGSRDATALFDHNLSLLTSRTDIQRRDALIYLTTVVAASPNTLPRPASQILEKAQPLMIDGSSSVRSQLLKLLTVLPADQLGDLSRTLLFARNGMTHLSNDIRLDALDIFDWLMATNGEAAVSVAGGWVKTLGTFQTVLSWQDAAQDAPAVNGNWSAAKTTKSSLGSNKLLVHQLNSLSRLLTVGLKRTPVDLQAQAKRAAELFPLWQTDAHMVSKKSNPYAYLNLFGPPRDVESEVYDDAEERANVFVEVGLDQIFRTGVQEAKKEGGENKRKEIIFSCKHHRPWFITCATSKYITLPVDAVSQERFSTAAQIQMTAEQEEEIEDTPQRNSKRQRRSAEGIERHSVGLEEKHEQARSHGPTPSPLTCRRPASPSSQLQRSPPDDALPENDEASLPSGVEPQTETQTQTTSASQPAMVIKEESIESTGANFPTNSLAAQMQSTIFQLVDARVDSRKLELADELNTMIDQSIEERVAEKLAIKEKEMEERITAHVMAELIKGFSGSPA
ncbi:Pre-rRNA-processing protein ipi1 [Pseudocercospora fuligena]|uniref:Pre-rRNA-processing protein n=1 Tax=Pseudocercospora fuligena TaxID=685502 RepID=A0A8H6VJH7_9PEZI|nr:Pre-rRNA-processing protein ipi1 [Pseudocercospora fuligena]